MAKQDAEEAEADEEESQEIISIASDDVKSVKFVMDKKEVTFEKDGDSWVKSDETAFPVDQDKMDTLISSLSSVKAERTLEDVEDASEYELEHTENTITAFFMPRAKGDRPDVIPDGCVNFAFLGQFAETPRDTIFTTEYSVRTAMEAVYGLMGVDRGVPEVWGSVYDVRELLDASVKLMDGRSPLEIELPGPLNLVKKPLLKAIKGTLVEKVLRDHDVIKDYMLEK